MRKSSAMTSSMLIHWETAHIPVWTIKRDTLESKTIERPGKLQNPLAGRVESKKSSRERKTKNLG